MDRFIDGFSVLENVLPVVFLALANIARNYTTTFFFYTKKKKPHHVYNPKS